MFLPDMCLFPPLHFFFFAKGVCSCLWIWCAGIRIKESKEVYEGEVVEITPEEGESSTGGYGKTVKSVVVSLKWVFFPDSLPLSVVVLPCLFVLSHVVLP